MSIKEELGVVYQTIKMIVHKIMKKELKKKTDPINKDEVWNNIRELGLKNLEKLKFFKEKNEKSELALQEAFEEEWNELIRKK